jgi:membrane-associated phospholipid phosphatase
MPKRPLEVLNLAAIAALSVVAVYAAAAGRLPVWPAILGRYALMALFVVIVSVLVRQEDRLPRLLRIAVNFYPAALVPMLYESLGVLIPAVRGPARDAWLIAADRALFHADPTVWLERWVNAPLTNVLFLAYATYYFFPVIVAALLWRHDPSLARKFIFGLSLAFYISYAGYFVIPAKGPRVALAADQTVTLEVTPFSQAISRTLNELEHTKDDAFPSGHTMITTFCLIAAFRYERRLFKIWLPIATLLIISTVYCRFHYVVDVMAGLALAFVAFPLGERVYGWLLSPQGVSKPAMARPLS